MRTVLLLVIAGALMLGVGCDRLKSEEDLAREALECSIEKGDQEAVAAVALLGGLDGAAEVLALDMTREEIIQKREYYCD